MNRRGMVSLIFVAVVAVTAITANLVIATTLRRMDRHRAEEHLVRLREGAWSTVHLAPGEELALGSLVLRRSDDGERGTAIGPGGSWYVAIRDGTIVGEGRAR